MAPRRGGGDDGGLEHEQLAETGDGGDSIWLRRGRPRPALGQSTFDQERLKRVRVEKGERVPEGLVRRDFVRGRQKRTQPRFHFALDRRCLNLVVGATHRPGDDDDNHSDQPVAPGCAVESVLQDREVPEGLLILSSSRVAPVACR